MKKEIHVCCICGNKFSGYGNSVWPIKEGVCCDSCNVEVIKARIEKFGVVFDNRKECAK